MSGLYFATDKKSRLAALLDEHARCSRAFFQNPTPGLGASLKRIEAAIKHQKRTKR